MIADEKGWNVDDAGFEAALAEQKARGRADAKRETGDWISVHDSNEVLFVGYDDNNVTDAKVIKHRTLKQKGKEIYQVVLDKTPLPKKKMT